MWAYLPKRAIILCRNSDADEDDLGRVERQERNGVAHAQLIKWGVLRVAVENDVSAFKRRRVTLPDGRRSMRVLRPEYRQILDDLADGTADGLIAIDLDRATRDPRDLEDLIDVIESSSPRIPVTSVTGSLRLDTDADITMARVMVAVANKSSRDTARRISDVRREQAEQGRYGGGAYRPFGFDDDGVTIRESEAVEIRKSIKNVLGKVSLRQEVLGLKQRQIPTVTGAEWTQTAWRQVLLRPRNAGILVHRGEETGRLPGKPIVEEAQWRAVVTKLTDPDRNNNPGHKGGPIPRTLGTLLYRCGVCGEHVTGRPGRTGVDGFQRAPLYTCRDGHVSRLRDLVDKAVETVIIKRLEKADAVDLLERPGPAIDKAVVQAGIEADVAKLDELVDAFDNDEITRDQLKRGTAKIKARIAEAQKLLQVPESRDPLEGLAGNPDARTFWDDLDDLGRKRSIIKTLVTVRIMPARRGRRRAGSDPMDPENLRVQIDWIR